MSKIQRAPHIQSSRRADRYDREPISGFGELTADHAIMGCGEEKRSRATARASFQVFFGGGAFRGQGHLGSAGGEALGEAEQYAMQRCQGAKRDGQRVGFNRLCSHVGRKENLINKPSALAQIHCTGLAACTV